MRKISVCDSETDPFKFGRIPEPFIWGYYDGDTFETFRETWQFIEFIRDRKEICYAHNGGKFDFFFMAEFVELLTPLTVINGRITKFKIGECEFRDSYAILPVPLAQHDKGKIDYSKFEAETREQHMQEITDYLYRDCASLHQLVSAYIDEQGPNLTLASGAMKAWCRMTDREPPKSSSAFYETFKPYYYGGRVQCFRKGLIEEPFQVADINSAYPFAMLSAHPYGTAYSVSNELPSNDTDTRLSFIRMRARSTGAFPCRLDMSLEFPADGIIREFFVTGHEFAAARDTGFLQLDDVLEVYRFAETISFPEYVHHYYSIKQSAIRHSAAYIIAKLMLNALYGKFGANPSEYEEYKVCHPADVYAMSEVYGYEFADFFGPHAVMCRPISEAAMHYYNVAVAASITGFVRAYLWRSMTQCAGLLYCDTDSIAALNTSRLPHGDNLGEWKIEATCDRGGVAGKKLYAFHDCQTGKWKTASKGVKFGHSEIMRICKGEAITDAKIVPTFSVKSPPRFVARTIRMT